MADTYMQIYARILTNSGIRVPQAKYISTSAFLGDLNAYSDDVLAFDITENRKKHRRRFNSWWMGDIENIAGGYRERLWTYNPFRMLGRASLVYAETGGKPKRIIEYWQEIYSLLTGLPKDLRNSLLNQAGELEKYVVPGLLDGLKPLDDLKNNEIVEGFLSRRNLVEELAPHIPKERHDDFVKLAGAIDSSIHTLEDRRKFYDQVLALYEVDIDSVPEDWIAAHLDKEAVRSEWDNLQARAEQIEGKDWTAEQMSKIYNK